MERFYEHEMDVDNSRPDEDAARQIREGIHAANRLRELLPERRESLERRIDERCECGHGAFWHQESCKATTMRVTTPDGDSVLIAGVPCTCLEYRKAPERRAI